MYKFMSLLLVCFCGLSLSACKQGSYTYEYLIQHPNVLEKEYDRCKSLQQMTSDQEEQCQVVDRAVNIVTETISEQRNGPEKFGLRVLLTEIAVNDLQVKLDHAQEKLAALQANSAPEKAVQKATEEVEGLTQAYNDKKNEVLMLLAVMGMSTPE